MTGNNRCNEAAEQTMTGMLIQSAADFHGRESRYYSFLEGLNENNPDIAVLAGDIDSNPSFFDFLEKVEIPVLIIPGNMDGRSMEEETAGFDNVVFLHEKIYGFNGINFIGAGGGNPRIDRAYSITENKWVPVSDASADVLVTHVPPKGIMDRMALGFHIGSEWVKDIMETMKPRLLICGHVHEDPGYAVHGKTTVVNCSIGRKGKYTLVDVDRKNDKIEVNMVV